MHGVRHIKVILYAKLRQRYNQ